MAYPALPDEGGCFIATAAYGADWQAEVQALRDFRDRYLLPYAAGRWFVAHYYDVSPGVCRLHQRASEHEADRAPLLTPLVVVALFVLGRRRRGQGQHGGVAHRARRPALAAPKSIGERLRSEEALLC